MRYRRLGKTDLRVSRLSMGCASLGQDYAGKPAVEGNDAIRLIHRAIESGINFFDTAPSYGESEKLLARALKRKPDCIVATKVSLVRLGDIAYSLSTFETLHCVQIHNYVGPYSLALDAVVKMKEDGQFQALGATVYTLEETVSAIKEGIFDFLQVPFNVLDQAHAVYSDHIPLIGRSPLLRGALSGMAGRALRFSLFEERLTSTLVGIADEWELYEALQAEAAARRKNPSGWCTWRWREKEWKHDTKSTPSPATANGYACRRWKVC